MRGKSIRCSCSLTSTGLLQGKPGELKKGEALKHLLARELVLLREFSHRQRQLQQLFSPLRLPRDVKHGLS